LFNAQNIGWWLVVVKKWSVIVSLWGNAFPVGETLDCDQEFVKRTTTK